MPSRFSVEEMVATIDQEKRIRLAKELDQMMHDKFLILPVYQRIKTYGYHKGVTFHPYITGMPYLFTAEKENSDEANTAKKN